VGADCAPADTWSSSKASAPGGRSGALAGPVKRQRGTLRTPAARGTSPSCTPCLHSRLLRALAGRLHRRTDDPDVQDACSEAWKIAMRAPGAPLHDLDHLAECLTVTAIRADFHAYRGTETRTALALGTSVLIAYPGASDT
jgi:hypothetical protein